MSKYFKDKGLDIISMFRGEDKVHNFRYTEPTGSVFLFEEYTITCIGRLSPNGIKPDFEFEVTKVTTDGQYSYDILFPKETINQEIRENSIYWRVFAQHNETGNQRVINQGELRLK